jgi:hypothetical protein
MTSAKQKDGELPNSLYRNLSDAKASYSSLMVSTVTFAEVENITSITRMPLKSYIEELRVQRWDDHRYYHHSRINQSLHFISAISFLVAYVMLFIDPAWAALIAWGISMTTRQAGHFFFEPHTYDNINQATHEHKEDIKLGYNLRRKVVLMSLWASAPVVLYFSPSLFGMMKPGVGIEGYLHNLGLIWLYLGFAGALFRTVHLFFLKSVITGLMWLCKILTDPFHDIILYWRSPFALLKGELMDPMLDVQAHTASH